MYIAIGHLILFPFPHKNHPSKMSSITEASCDDTSIAATGRRDTEDDDNYCTSSEQRDVLSQQDELDWKEEWLRELINRDKQLKPEEYGKSLRELENDEKFHKRRQNFANTTPQKSRTNSPCPSVEFLNPAYDASIDEEKDEEPAKIAPPPQHQDKKYSNLEQPISNNSANCVKPKTSSEDD